jgi:L-lactate dehydrogenase complex protein LldF
LAQIGKKLSLAERVSAGLADTHSRHARRHAFGLLRQTVPILASTIPHLQEELRSMKLAALADTTLVGRAVKQLRANGCHVFEAATAAEARDYILQVCNQPGIMIKSKSNAVKEIAVKESLEAQSITWIDSDLGDWMNQLAGTEGSHVLAPAIQFTKEDFADQLGAWLGETLPPDAPTLVHAASRGLRPYLEGARYGMTGANAIAADEGAIILMENEGNIRAVIALPEIHIVVGGIHKVVPTLRDGI